MNKLLLSLLILACATATADAQVTGLFQDFNDGTLTGWEIPDDQTAGTFALEPEDGSMKILYDRTGSSYEWDNFNYIPPQDIDISGHPYISVKVKSDVSTQLTFKPIFADGRDGWLQYDVPGDGQWRTITFEVTMEAPLVMTRLYVYLDGGSTTPVSGTTFFDEVGYGDSARIELDYSTLIKAITSAEALKANTVEGTGEGEYATGSKEILQTAIDEAKLFLEAGTEEPDELDQAVWNLYDACVSYETGVTAIPLDMVDDNLTKETRYLYLNLQNLAERYILFGMHDATGYGVGWSGDNDRSDVYSVVGNFPAMYSEDVSQIQMNNDIQGVYYRMTEAYKRGGVITMCWHQYDPDGRSFYADRINNERIVEKILPGGERHQYYKDMLWKVALFFKSLRGEQGESIPVIFRPYHEHTGAWFWWGKNHRTTEEYNQIWRFTTEYLRDSLNVHNLLYAISPTLDHVDAGTQYYDTYPGDEYVDIFGIDKYFNGSTIRQSDVDVYLSGLRTIAAHAKEKNKLCALTEVGNENLEMTEFFTKLILDPVKNDQLANSFSYAAVWRNESTTHHFAPYPGHPSVPDFEAFYNDPYTLFEAALPDMYILPTPDSTPPLIVSDHSEVLVSWSPEVAIEVETDEKAFLRYGYEDAAFEALPHTFEEGEGRYQHATSVEGVHGETITLHVRAKDLYGNTSAQAAVITFRVDTMQTPVAWTDYRYPLAEWSFGATPIGTDASAATQSAEVKTLYARTTLEFDEIPGGLAVLVKTRGGAACYINGVEIGRVNLPEDEALGYDTPATSDATVNKYFTVTADDVSMLREGANVVAVELHAPAGGSVPTFDSQIILAPSTVMIPLGSEWAYSDAGALPAVYTLDEITGVDQIASAVPEEFKLHNNYPNPFNPETTIAFDLREPVDVKLVVYDMLGAETVLLADEKLGAGSHTRHFNGAGLASGVYTAVLTAGGYRQAVKMLLLK